MIARSLLASVCLCMAVLGVNLGSTDAYMPVVFMHGILGDYQEGDQLLDWIKRDHAGTQTYTINAYNKADSVVNLLEQLQTISVLFKTYMDKHPDGINLLCFSQGGVICRGLLQMLEHNVHTFISLSSPQAGQFGDTSYLKFLFPNALRDTVYKFAYTPLGQNISVGNYWNDPHHQDLYRKYCKFLPVFNNETTNPLSQKYKENFSRLQRLVMIGGPDDGVISPWQSSQFGLYDKDLNLLPMENQTYFLEDSFGLRTLHEKGGIIKHTQAGVHHTHWHSTPDVYKKYILPYLD